MRDKVKILWKKFIHKTLKVIGVMFVILGFIGFALPIMPGWIFLILGLVILGEESIVTGWIIKRLPKKMQVKVRSYFKKIKRKGKKVVEEVKDKMNGDDD